VRFAGVRWSECRAVRYNLVVKRKEKKMKANSVKREKLSNGKYRYVTADGEVIVAASVKRYVAASTYRKADGKVATFLHTRPDLAVKGNSTANRIAAWGGFVRIPGVVPVEES
jgi:hypothetical protein